MVQAAAVKKPISYTWACFDGYADEVVSHLTVADALDRLANWLTYGAYVLQFTETYIRIATDRVGWKEVYTLRGTAEAMKPLFLLIEGWVSQAISLETTDMEAWTLYDEQGQIHKKLRRVVAKAPYMAGEMSMRFVLLKLMNVVNVVATKQSTNNLLAIFHAICDNGQSFYWNLDYLVTPTHKAA